MKNTIFVDTSGFYALLIKQDDKHEEAKATLMRASQEKHQFITTDYILDETITLLHSRGHGHLLASFLETIFSSRACTVVWVEQERFLKTRSFFLRHSDHNWSFTDCVSFVVMKELKLTSALTKDKHFQEAGFISLLSS